MFGFTGAARSGKTTLAKRVSEEIAIPYFDAATTQAAKEAGFNAVGNLPIGERMELQEFLLKTYLKRVEDAPRPFITDRTPLDMIAYTMAEVSMHGTTLEQGKRIHKYYEDCLKAVNNLFHLIIIVRPLPFYTVDPTKPPENPAYQWHTQLLMEGGARLMRPPFMTLGSDALEDRIFHSVQAIGQVLHDNAEEQKQARLH